MMAAPAASFRLWPHAPHGPRARLGVTWGVSSCKVYVNNDIIIIV